MGGKRGVYSHVERMVTGEGGSHYPKGKPGVSLPRVGCRRNHGGGQHGGWILRRCVRQFRNYAPESYDEAELSEINH